MTAPTVLLVRYETGYVEVVDAAAVSARGRIRGFLAVGSAKTAAEATKLGQAELARISMPRDQVDLGADPDPAAPANAVYTGYNLGDFVLAPNRAGVNTGYRVRGIAIAEDDDAMLTVAPTLSSRLEEQAVRIERQMRRMQRGTFSGSSMVATPIDSPSTIIGRWAERETITFSWPQMNTDLSPADSPQVHGRLAQLHLTIGTPSTSAIEVKAYVNGVYVTSGIIIAGNDFGFGFINTPFGPGDKLELQLAAVPSDGSGLSARVVHAHYTKTGAA